MKHLVIIGAGELGRELYWHAQESKGYNTDFDIKGYIDDDYSPDSERYCNLQKPLISSIDDYTVEFNLKKPFAPFQRIIGIQVAPKHVFNEVVQRGKRYFTCF